MSNYIPHYTKKIHQLSRLEQKLTDLAAKGLPEKKLLEAAERVRQGRVRVCRAALAMLPPVFHRNRATLCATLADAEQQTAAAILSEFI